CFQAEDGIRDFHVTGVQTCALPIYIARSPLKALSTGALAVVHSASGKPLGQAFVNPNALICGRMLSRDIDEAIDRRFLKRRLQRSEERRVGNEGRYRGPLNVVQTTG